MAWRRTPAVARAIWQHNCLIPVTSSIPKAAAFAADIPPALLADKLGLSIGAAVAWSKAAGAARADYAGLRNAPAIRKR